MPKYSKENLVKSVEELQKWLARKQETYKADPALINTSTKINSILSKLKSDDSKQLAVGVRELELIINSLKWTHSEDRLNKDVADLKRISTPKPEDKSALERGELLQDMFKIQSKDVKDNLRSELKKILDVAKPLQNEMFKRQVAQGGGLFKPKQTAEHEKKTPPKLGK